VILILLIEVQNRCQCLVVLPKVCQILVSLFQSNIYLIILVEKVTFIAVGVNITK